MKVKHGEASYPKTALTWANSCSYIGSVTIKRGILPYREALTCLNYFLDA